MKRLVALALWFYAGWTMGALIDFVAGGYGVTVGPALAPILATAAAALVAGDPRGLIWGRREASASRATSKSIATAVSPSTPTTA
jgi:hypothetical protein